MDCGEATETAEIGDIESDDETHAMDIHGRCQPRIVYLYAHDPLLHNNPAPLSINSLTVRQENHASLDSANFTLSIGSTQAQAIPRLRPGHCIPKLSNVLVCVVKNRALGGESGERRIYELVLGIGAPCHPQQGYQPGTTQSPFSCGPGRAIHGKWFRARAESFPRTGRASQATRESPRAFAAAELPQEALTAGPKSPRHRLRGTNRGPWPPLPVRQEC